jgi:hypothetical protein
MSEEDDSRAVWGAVVNQNKRGGYISVPSPIFLSEDIQLLDLNSSSDLNRR